MTGAVLFYPYARSGPGLGCKAKTGAGSWQLGLATVTALLVTALSWWAGLGWAALFALVATMLTAFLSAQWIQSRIGGLTGDALGAICEMGEMTGLLVLTTLVFRGVLP
jgi:adenosylcobinamide-GDP ribazoletransferase